ncbi:glycoside hydrolase family 15 [Actinotalea sp. BY-33]|uniref:Glycoside hydrolase family 15 n=1 Tax=Actinotalea soli TaxID=2819234 RepID=A0A939LQG2_9CELL|nr:glycoside hydrolase family 15 protein [Actinotalea soli]MBO1751923.1 glycoside hydrolase family 15 [Actinotalea soli]
MSWAPSRRAVTVGAAAAVVALATAGVAVWHVDSRYEEIPLYADGIVVDAAGLPQVVLGDPTAQDDPAHRVEQNLWIERGTVPGPESYADMAEQALRDLDALVLPGGAAIAGANPAWRYVWPRDASFTAVALARTGHTEDALEVLDYLRVMQDVTSTGGVFEARYLPDGTGAVPDQRGLQLDGNGWVLWAVAEWYAEAEPGAQRDADLERLRPLVERSVTAIRSNIDPATGVPGVFSDYWEVRETAPTLGTLAPLLAGVRAAEPVLEALGEPSAADLEALLSRAVDEEFAPDGYPRHLGGRHRDTSVAFLMPPFAPLEAEVAEAWTAAAEGMARPGGGLAPGEGWKSDGISWTPETAIWALTAAASGDVEQAEHWLDWLDEHRTERGALPEKVLWDGSPSAVAPLAWTASTVLITLDELDRLEETG